MSIDAKSGLTPEQIEALQSFAKRNGRCWKSKLCTLYMNGRDAVQPEGPFLRQVRNTIGPSGLYRMRLDKTVALSGSLTRPSCGQTAEP
ncbi:hypothetical protein RZS28_19890 (plasmid) [Methylocapsa polymorpha]|uniref:Uncharacterized protein n=1 Tax=Methylocapsa polymorpha TaxID=3080828 RepID=A0ABZ0HWU6_9HYPH|nr:hypothetical protein [Methylocapsa sp. RX1]WOJ91708.1 hypothetical protein RZS28_19890 [Methylocapsa sp. RX1]